MESQLLNRNHRTLFLTWVCGVHLLCQEHDSEQILFEHVGAASAVRLSKSTDHKLVPLDGIPNLVIATIIVEPVVALGT